MPRWLFIRREAARATQPFSTSIHTIPHSYFLLFSSLFSSSSIRLLVAMNGKSSLIATFHRLIPLCSIYSQHKLLCCLIFASQSQCALHIDCCKTETKASFFFSLSLLLCLPHTGCRWWYRSGEWQMDKNELENACIAWDHIAVHSQWTLNFCIFPVKLQNAKYCNGIDITCAITTA